ncbi:ubiquinol-cytochrome C chaperone family protein [Henriciella aquimarina]|uniref:ubiquinol-cytochrome C chaperone family protein n=1 Tax=Henriciella aquimarina TaxID=545261 RepID=UPI001301FA76|nr:ubiquinol-cytochrome C chaperone family protein [Henriciella aquimarina]
MNWLSRTLFPTRHHRSTVAARLYGEIVSKARTPSLFGEDRLPDTLEGRFQATALYAALIFPLLEREGPEGQAISAELYRRLFQSFDDALRETGVGDASIARKIRKMGEAFFGLGQAVTAAIESSAPPPQLRDVLERNTLASAEGCEALAERLLADHDRLRKADMARVMEGYPGW